MKTATKITFVLCMAVIFTAITPLTVLAEDTPEETNAEDEAGGGNKYIDGAKDLIGAGWDKAKNSKAGQKVGDVVKKGTEKVVEKAEEGIDNWAEKNIFKPAREFFKVYAEFPVFILAGRTSAQALFIFLSTILLLLIYSKSNSSEKWKGRYGLLSYLVPRAAILASCVLLNSAWEEGVQSLILNWASGIIAIPLAIILVIYLYGAFQAFKRGGKEGVIDHFKGEPIIVIEDDEDEDEDEDDDEDEPEPELEDEPDSDSDPDSDSKSRNFDLKRFKNR